MKNKAQTLVIYHADCLDGLAAAWAAFNRFGHQARYFAARFGEAFPRFGHGADIYIVDFSYPPKILLNAAQKAARITLIDHHVTAQTQYEAFFQSHDRPANLTLLFDLTRSGAVLSWRYFCPNQDLPKILLHIEDRDLWQFKLPGTEAITSALYQQMPMSFAAFGRQNLAELERVGTIQAAQLANLVKRLVKNAHRVVVAGETGLAVNAPSFFASDLGHMLAEKSGTFGMTYQYDGGKNQWLYALRSVGGCNVGQIAQSFGGGGHPNAAGFSLPDNPFLTSIKQTYQDTI